MQAKQIAFFVIAFSVSMTIVTGTGIFDYDPGNYVVNVDEDLTKDITEMKNSVESGGDLASLVDGWMMLKNTFDSMITIFSVFFLPGPWLYDMGVGFNESAGIQTMVTLAEAWGLAQFFSNRSTKGME